MVRNTRTNGTAFTPLERFWKFARKLPNGCWDWIGTRNQKGYSRFFLKGRLIQAHRFAYEQWIGPIPENCELHHRCKNPSCVNPDHLEALTHAKHMKLKITASSRLLHRPTYRFGPPRRSHCIRGHPLIDGNRIANGKSGLACRECRRIHYWCLRHGLRITQFTPEQLAALVPKRRA